MHCFCLGCEDFRDTPEPSVFQLLQVLHRPFGLVCGFGRQGAAGISAAVFPQEQVGCEAHPGCYKSSVHFWPRTPPREGQGLSEHLIFPMMPAKKNNTHLSHSARTASPQLPLQQHPLLTIPLSRPPRPCVVYPQPHFGTPHGEERVNAGASPTNRTMGYPTSSLRSWGAGSCSCSTIVWTVQPQQGSLRRCGSRQEVMLSPFCASS